MIRADLDRSGQFRGLPERDMVERPTRGSEVNFPTWRLLKQDFLVVGRVLDAGDGGYRVEYELFDVAKQQRLLGFAMTARAKRDARCRPPDRRCDLREDPRRARRVLDPHRLRHRQRRRQGQRATR